YVSRVWVVVHEQNDTVSGTFNVILHAHDSPCRDFQQHWGLLAVWLGPFMYPWFFTVAFFLCSSPCYRYNIYHPIFLPISHALKLCLVLRFYLV
ncbi:hypothetical protein GIB67_023760, partial [Kingdonia uniflora]